MSDRANERLFRGPVWGTEAAAKKVKRSKTWVRIAVIAGKVVPSVPVGDSGRRLFSQDDLARLALAAGTHLDDGESEHDR
jgi:hypothetical protein